MKKGEKGRSEERNWKVKKIEEGEKGRSEEMKS